MARSGIIKWIVILFIVIIAFVAFSSLQSNWNDNSERQQFLVNNQLAQKACADHGMLFVDVVDSSPSSKSALCMTESPCKVYRFGI